MTIGLCRYKGHRAYDRESARELEEWTYTAHPPGRLLRSLGVTLDLRIEAAIAKLEERWARYIEAADAAFVAAGRIGDDQ